ncbi:LIM domain-containing protein [Aphelenchoides avenae]|nr:LIM domain-containing protein [Aphelenchus avenae]
MRSTLAHGPNIPHEAEYIVRIPGMEQEYHVDCYNCEGCAKRLGNDPDRRCYPLDGHLLCRSCHVQWKRLGGANQPITDL